MAKCDHCGQELPRKVYDIDDAQRLFDILTAQPEGYVYISQTGTWHVTRMRGEVNPTLVETMCITGDLHNVYKDHDHQAYTLASRPMIDVDAIIAERRAAKKSPSASREYQRNYYRTHRGRRGPPSVHNTRTEDTPR